MTRSRVAVLWVILLAVASGTGGGLWHLYATNQIPALPAHADAPAPTAEPRAAGSGAAPVSPAPAGPSSAPPVVAERETPSPAAAPDQSPRQAPPAPVAAPSFDIVRVEPRGDTVVAGKGAPNAEVALMSGGKVVGETKSDANGQFVILPPRLAPGDHALTLRQTPEGKPAEESTQSVAVSVPPAGQGKVVVALAEPGQATKLLSAPPETSSTPPGADAKVAIRSAELENGDGFYASGVGRPGAQVHVYLNDAHLADVKPGPDGAWSVRVKRGLTGGHYVVRADAASPDGKTVTSRAEVPFDVPMAMADAAKPAPKPVPMSQLPSPAASRAASSGAPPPNAAPSGAAEPETSASGSDATIDTVATARIVRGDNLWDISRVRLGDGMRYTQIYAANSGQIRDPNLIYPGQVFVVPKR